MIHTIFYYIEHGTDPYENLALEQYLTETAQDGVCTLYLWQNRHTVVIGRNQNAWQECRTTELEKDGGTLVRRLSGGGAVYHDLGNLNFTFCVRTQDYDLHRQQRVIVEACRLLGIPAEISGRNDVLTDGRKFSGNSFYSHDGHSFHNGTLLLNVDMANLGKYLNPSKAKLNSKGVASVRSRVVNLCELKPELTLTMMENAMIAAFETVYGCKARSMTTADFDRKRLEELHAQFASWDWNYGKMRPFSFSCAHRFSWGEITLEFAVRNGLCEDVTVYTDAMETDFAAPLREGLRSCRFAVEELCARVRSVPECSAFADDLCTLLREQDI
ncbi:MAG: lipoate--protein ligase [Eubacteriales bacterium]|nr:lipoate--protein ligase [Eubacteriales bacterium]